VVIALTFMCKGSVSVMSKRSVYPAFRCTGQVLRAQSIEYQECEYGFEYGISEYTEK
jgi:hypothetical protein